MDATEPGTLLTGRYRLAEVLGQGGMGVVWRAHDELLNRDVAIKQLVWPPHLTPGEQETACRRAVREAQMAGRLSHPNIVRVYDIVEADSHPWIIMELVPYQSLRDLIREQGPLQPGPAAQVGLGVLAALGAAHRAGILHRDVKPGNILVGPDMRAVLTDFGIARATDSPTLTTGGALLGSPSFIAPERAKGGASGGAGAPSDLWGLGASLYAAVEGRPPFERKGALATLTAVVLDEPEPPRHAGPLAPVIDGLLRKDPDERLTADAAERMLLQVVSDSQLTAEAEPEAATPPGDDAESASAGLTTHAMSVPAPVTEEVVASPGEPDAAAALLPSAPPAEAKPKPAGTAGSKPAAKRGRRGALVALAAAVVVTVGVTILAVDLAGSPTRAGAAPGPSRSAASPSTSASPSAPATSAPASPSASAAASPSSSGSNSGSATDALPAGFYRFTNSTGFSIGVPDGWQISHVGHYVYIRDPADSGIFLLIDQSDQPQANPLADWEQQQANRASSYPDYHLIRLASVDYPQAEKAADWEFTYLRDGVLVQILNRNVLANAKHAYALYWSTPEADWNSYYKYFQDFAATFRPAPA